MRGAALALLAGVLLAAAMSMQAARAAPGEPVPGGVERQAMLLRAALVREVPGVIVDGPEWERGWAVRARAAIEAAGNPIEYPQLILVVDRNPRVQQMRIVVARPDGPWLVIGGTRVSTGQRGRRDYFLTPTGVFLHTDLILDWRAEGTFNENHIRGLGVKGMRVWDFGWQTATRGWGEPGESEIRLLLHATDPRYLEPRLGRAASKGCVRIPAAMNVFLDRHGVLDRDYESAAQTDDRFAALLLPDRTPTPLAGNAMVVIDSSETAQLH
jgi:hypothetical protein